MLMKEIISNKPLFSMLQEMVEVNLYNTLLKQVPELMLKIKPNKHLYFMLQEKED